MRYVDGSMIKLADRVKLLNGDIGTVVCSIDSKEYSNDFEEQDWGYLGQGIIVKTDRGAIVHLSEPNRGDVVRVA